jgi:hypothetical protein
MTPATSPRETWHRVCERDRRLARHNPFFAPMLGVLQSLEWRPCAEQTVVRLDGVDLRVAPAARFGLLRASDGLEFAVDLQLRALLDDLIEIRCVERAVRARPLVRIMHARTAANAIERCLWEIGWVSDDALWRCTSYGEPNTAA